MGNTASSVDSDEDIIMNQKGEDVVSTAATATATVVENERSSVPLLDLSTLFDISMLRNMAAKIPEEMPENILQRHQDHLIHWLEEELQRNQETVTLSQFYDVLLNRSVDRNECRKVFQQFDYEGEGMVDVKLMLDFLKKYNGSTQFVDISSIIKTFQSCSYAPGFIDIYNEDKESIGRHASCLLKFIMKNRASVATLPYVTLKYFNSVVSMRLSVLRNHFAKLQKSTVAAQRDVESHLSSSKTEFYPVTKCIVSYEVSSNKADGHRLFVNESSYWQSDGSARSHWIRLRMRANILIKQLSIGVSLSDQSYMPQHVVVLVGRDLNDLHEIRETKIPAHMNGDVILLENARVHYPIVQIGIKRCHSEGCDTRIHSIKMLGYRPSREQGVTPLDAASSWLLQVVSDTAIACLPTVPSLRTNILDHTRNALSFMPPLSLSPASGDRPPCISLHVLKEVDAFLQKMAVGPAGVLSKDSLDVLLSFSLSQGHLVSAIKTLMLINEAQVKEFEMRKLLQSIGSVSSSFWRKNGQQLHMVLLGSDGGQKDDTSAASNVLNPLWVTSQPYITGYGRLMVNMFFRGSDQVQLTKLRIKVDKGDRGPKCGLVFVYNKEGEFNLEEHVKQFKYADSFTHVDYTILNQLRSAALVEHAVAPVAYFNVSDDWDEVEVAVDTFPVGQYVLVKFLGPRNSSAERLSIVGVKFFGFDRCTTQVGYVYDILNTSIDSSTLSPQFIVQKVLAFFVALARDQSKHITQNSFQVLNMTDLSMQILWDFYCSIKHSHVDAGLLLQLLHALFPYLANLMSEKDQVSTDAFFQHLCELVDSVPSLDDSPAARYLLQSAKEVITDGAAVFFPDKDARSTKLFCLIKDISDTNEAPSVTLTFQSLCQFFSNVDPSALLDLPSSSSQDFDSSQVMQVMATLVSVAYRECLSFLQTETVSEKSSHLVHLLCSLQTNLLMWCCCQLESSNKRFAELAGDVVRNYISLVSSKVASALESFEQCSIPHMTVLLEKLKISFLCSTFSQLVLVLSHLCSFLSSPDKVNILSDLLPIVVQLHKISRKLPEFFHHVDSSFWQKMERDEEVLKVWEVESSHNYENNLNVVQVFSCPGASTFFIEFDQRCETEKRYDYLEFTDARGNKTRYDQKVNTEKWPLHVSFGGGSRLQFVFRSDSSNNEWGYKFKVTAKGNSDVSLCWMFDVYLNLSKLIGQLSGSSLDITKVLPKCDVLDGQDELELEFLLSDLWTTLFHSGYHSSLLKQAPSGIQIYGASTSAGEFILNIIDDTNEEAKRFLSKCKEHVYGNNQNAYVGSAAVNDATLYVFCALLWHTEVLHEDINKYIKDERTGKLPDGIIQAYNTAESMRRSFMALERNREKANTQDASKSYNALTAVKEKALFLLRFSAMTKIHSRAETKLKHERKLSKIYNRVSSISSDKTLKTESVFDKYPSFRLVLDFIQDSAWSTERVEHMLSERVQMAEITATIFTHLVKFLRIVSDDSTEVFQIPVVLLFQDLLNYQEKFPQHYLEGLDGCGSVLEEKVRSAYYEFVRYLVKVLDVSSKTGLNRRDCVQCYDYVESCALHFLGVNWQLCDLPFLEELRLPDLYYRLTIASLSVHEETPAIAEEEPELDEYKSAMLWLEECRKSGFTQWHERHRKDNQKAVQLFSARYSEALEIELSCDGCSTTLPGGRYRCLECTDINVCASCYADGVVLTDGHTVEHYFIHFLFRCDGCQGFITGTRIHCNVCEDFDLCLGCHNGSHFPSERHRPEHSFVLFSPKHLTLVKATYSLLKSYVHNHVWLLFSSLALSVANIVYSRPHDSADCSGFQSAIQLHGQFIEILTSCCMLVPISTLPLLANNDEDVRLRKMQEEAFVLYSHEKIMGLLGAMIPERNKAQFTDDISPAFVSDQFISTLFSIASGETGRDCNLQHFALGLIGQLLQRIPRCCKLADMALGSVSDSEESESNPTQDSKPEGYRTMRYLFQLGANCLERSGLEWANTMATVLQKLFVLSTWQELVLNCLNESIENLKKGPSLSSIFALYVLAGFPEVLALGSLVKYTEIGTEPKFGIVMKHFTDKNRTLIIDRSTRRRQTLKDICIEVVSFNNCVVSESNLVAFIGIIKDLVSKMKNGELFTVESSWVLYLVLKALFKATTTQSTDDGLTKLFEPEFIQCVVYLAGLGTGFSKQWLISDMEVLSLMLYTKDDHKRLNSITVEDDGGSVMTSEQMTSSSEGSTCGPLEDLDNHARQTFNTLHANLHVPLSVLRALYETHGCSTDALILAVHENLRKEDGFNPSEEILKLSKKWEEQRTASLMDLGTDKAIDIGLQLMSVPYINEKKEFEGKATEEPMHESQRLITTVDGNLKVTFNRQRYRNSAALLRRELEKDRSDPSAEFLIKVNNALSVLYARQVLTALLADRSTSRHVITADLIGCRVEADLPYVLDLLNRPESQDTFHKMVQNVIQHCQPDGLVSVAKICCEFMEEVSLMTVIKQNCSTRCESDEPVQDKIHIPGALYLSIQFDSRCFTEDNDVKLIMSSSSDHKQDRRVFSGPNYQWSNFEIPGDAVYFKFTHDSSSEWFYKFTVLGSRFGRFDTGYRILNGILDSPSMIHSLPLDLIWRSLVRVACKQIGQRRLKTIQLLLLIIHSQFRNAGCTSLSVELGLLCPLWRLHRKMAEDFQDSVCILPPLMCALTELFFSAENLAMEWGIADNYAVSLIDDDDVRGYLSQGLEVIAAISFSIGYKNKATEAFQTTPKQLVVNSDLSKVVRSPKTVVIV